jgi:lysophospholipase L1-like esterase
MLKSLVLCYASCLWAADGVNAQLTLPPRGYAVVGQTTGVWFDNLVLDENSARYRFKVTADMGESAERGWSVTPAASDVGEHVWRVEVLDGETSVASGSFPWTVVSADAAKDRPLRLLIVGDSLTHASLYPNDLARRLSEPGGPKWEMLGTHRPANVKPGVAHEGYGGWTWDRFATHFEPNPDLAARKFSSPFVFATEAQPRLDVARYLKESCGNSPPDVVFFLLGINDCFGANPNDPKAMDATIDRMFASADTLLKSFREAAPNADFAIGLTTPGNSRDASFEANYKGRHPRWGWKRIQHRIVQRQIEKFAGREKERLFVVPTELNVDPVDGYPVDNGVHPNAHGYAQVAANLHAWLLWRLGSR